MNWLTSQETACINEVMNFCGLNAMQQRIVMAQCRMKARASTRFNAYTWAHNFCAPFNRLNVTEHSDHHPLVRRAVLS